MTTTSHRPWLSSVRLVDWEWPVPEESTIAHGLCSTSESTDCTVGRYALARGSSVYGFVSQQQQQPHTTTSTRSTNTTTTTTSTSSTNTTIDDTTTVPFLTPAWQVSLGSDHAVVTQVVTNTTGTIVAVAIAGGTVAVLRALDGAVLVTRSLPTRSDVRLSFGVHANGHDTLCIEILTRDHDPTTNTTTHGGQLVVVSHMDGSTLPTLALDGRMDDADVTTTTTSLAHAVARWRIHTLTLPDDLRSVREYRTRGDPETPRFVGMYAHGRALGVYRTVLVPTTAHEAAELVPETPGAVDEHPHRILDAEQGLSVASRSFGKPGRDQDSDPFFFVGSYSGTEASRASGVFWWDPDSVRVVCHYNMRHGDPVPFHSKASVPKVLDLTPIQAYSDDTLALAVAYRTSTGACLQVLQVLLDETMGLTVLANPHVVFTIPLETRVPLAVGSLSPTPPNSHPQPFGFFVQTALETSHRGTGRYRFFLPDATAARVGHVCQLLQRGDLDAAEAVVGQYNLAQLDHDNGHVSFHPSQIALKRLASLLDHHPWVETDVAQRCLHNLARGARTGNRFGVRSLLQAVDLVLECPVRDALLAMNTVIDTVVQTTFPESTRQLHTALVAKQRELQDRLDTVRYLETVELPSSRSVAIRSARTPSHLFATLVREGCYGMAEALWYSHLRSSLSDEVLVASVLNITHEVDPSAYIPLLRDVVLPSLAINHELLPTLREWACRTADALDHHWSEEKGLAAAIQLLEVVDRGTKDLQLRIHQSFATYSPFVTGLNESTGRKLTLTRRSPRARGGVGSEEVSHDSQSMTSGTLSSRHTSGAEEPSSTTAPTPTTLPESSVQRTAPTVLKLGHLEIGAVKRRQPNTLLAMVHGDDDDDCIYEDNEQCVEDKLHEAACLAEARGLGFTRDAATLRTFGPNGGETFCAQQLVQLCSRGSESHDVRAKNLAEQVKPFCSRFGVDYDTIVLQCSESLCRGKHIGEDQIREATSIACCCESVSVKCHGILAALRAALLCGCSADWLTHISKNAVAWASADSKLQSELIEASRLLLIDSIVRKYCGSGAKDLFRVDNPRHAVRLLDFVTKHLDRESVVDDISSLCDAFTHLSPKHAFGSLIQRALLQDKVDLAAAVLAQLWDRNPSLAESTLASTVSFAEEILHESSAFDRNPVQMLNHETELVKQNARRMAIGISALIQSVMEHTVRLNSENAAEIDCWTVLGSLPILKASVERICSLQSESGVYTCLDHWTCTSQIVSIASDLVLAATEDHLECEEAVLRPLIKKARRGVSLLESSSTVWGKELWSVAARQVLVRSIRENPKEKTLILLQTADLDAPFHSPISTYTQLTTVVELCRRGQKSVPVEGMKLVTVADSLLRNQVLPMCGAQLLPVVVSLRCFLDTAIHVFLQADEGVGEQIEQMQCDLKSEILRRGVDSSIKHSRPLLAQLPSPKFHPSWYVGDGLLLPPQEALDVSMDFCLQGVRNDCFLSDRALKIHRFLGERGAHFLSLRILCWSSVVQSCYRGPPLASGIEATAENNCYCAVRDTMNFLAERSLGGSSSGITSGSVDSELAVTFLLSLPMKSAFNVYKSALPSGIKTRAFDRVLSLANVGRVACTEGTPVDFQAFSAVGWAKQTAFARQCERLALKASWWKILEGFGIEFDPQRFDVGETHIAGTGTASSDLARCDPTYTISILEALLWKTSKILESPIVLRLCGRFAASFDLPRVLVLQKHVEYLLSAQITKAKSGHCVGIDRDPRSDLHQCRRIAQASLLEIEPPVRRCEIVRRCILALQDSSTSETDYERYSMLFSLYHDSLTFVLDNDTAVQGLSLNQLEDELESVDRRRDALAILSDFFQGPRLIKRPGLSNFFPPLRSLSLNAKPLPSLNKCSMFGTSTVSGEHFDPLHCLDKLLSESQENVTALAPLCLPLGLPQGYIHARSLVVRFKAAANRESAYPSLENDVVPVLNRLRSHTDKYTLADWCASYFTNNDTDNENLACIDLALQSAIEASNEAERRMQHSNGDDKEIMMLEQFALEKLRTISLKRDALTDRLKVKAILTTCNGSHRDSVSRLSCSLAQLLDAETKSNPNMMPEDIVDFLLRSGSRLTALASLDDKVACTTEQFRQFSLKVKDACSSIAERYSHIHPDEHCKQLARRWLLFGEKDHSLIGFQSVATMSGARSTDVSNEKAKDDDESEFIMDIADLQAKDDWDDGIALPKQHSLNQFTSEEERSSLLPISMRELSEVGSHRASLRIAFVLVVADEYKSLGARAVEIVDENAGSGALNLQKTKAKGRLGLLSRIETKRESRNESSIIQLSRELLRVVFGASDSAITLFGANSSFDGGVALNEQSTTPKSITFAMRHRALRAAAILCPQEILERVINESVMSEFASKSALAKECLLKDCAFGSYVAKEIEEMGLSLPHSDLRQLSTMHFLSYARSLWRHHRGGEMKGYKGRLLLLLLEMCLKAESTDNAFVTMLLNEMNRLQLPRTLLHALELTSNYNGAGDELPFVQDPSFLAALSSLIGAMSSELQPKECTLIPDAYHFEEVVESLSRLGCIVRLVSWTTSGNDSLTHFTNLAASASSQACFEPISKDIRRIVESTSHQMNAKNLGVSLQVGTRFAV